MPTRFERIRKTQIPQATRGPWRSTPTVRLGRRGTLYFSHHAAEVFSGRRLAVAEFDPQSLVVRFTGIDAVPADMDADDCFRLTAQSKQTNGMSLAAKSLFAHLGVHMNGHAQTIEIVEMNPAKHQITLRLPLPVATFDRRALGVA